MSYQEVTYNQSSQIRSDIWDSLKATNYIINLFSDQGTPKKYTQPLDTVIVNKFPAIAIMDNTDIDFSEGNYDRVSEELFFIEIITKADSWEKSKDQARLIAQNIISILDNIETQAIEKMDLKSFKNVNSIESAPKSWTYSLRITYLVTYRNYLV